MRNQHTTSESAETQHRPPFAGATGLLAGTWLAYWIALPVAALWTPVRLFLGLRDESRAPAMSLSGDDGLRLQVTADNVTMWSGAVSFAELAAWVTGPPLVIWLIWFWWVGRSGRRAPLPADASGEVPKLRHSEMPGQFATPGEHESKTPHAVNRSDDGI